MENVTYKNKVKSRVSFYSQSRDCSEKEQYRGKVLAGSLQISNEV